MPYNYIHIRKANHGIAKLKVLAEENVCMTGCVNMKQNTSPIGMDLNLAVNEPVQLSITFNTFG